MFDRIESQENSPGGPAEALEGDIFAPKVGREGHSQPQEGRLDSRPGRSAAARAVRKVLPKRYRLSARSRPLLSAHARTIEEPRRATTPRGSEISVVAQCVGWVHAR